MPTFPGLCLFEICINKPNVRVHVRSQMHIWDMDLPSYFSAFKIMLQLLRNSGPKWWYLLLAICTLAKCARYLSHKFWQFECNVTLLYYDYEYLYYVIDIMLEEQCWKHCIAERSSFGLQTDWLSSSPMSVTLDFENQKWFNVVGYIIIMWS